MQDMMGLLKTARDMQKNMKKAQKELAKTVVSGHSNDDSVAIHLSCNHQVKQVQLAAEVMTQSTSEMEKVIEQALNDALKKVSDKNEELMAPLKKGLPSIPGLGF
jgi:DNA-binding YbaB/EbfC family protein